jgi:hypothetical protein
MAVSLQDKALNMNHPTADNLKEAVQHKVVLSVQKF